MGKGRKGKGGAATAEAPADEAAARAQAIESLLAEVQGQTPAPTSSSVGAPAAFHTIPLAAIVESPHNPRKHFDLAALEELTASIQEQGIWEPLLVRPHPTEAGKYELASGHRRCRAARKANLAEVPVIIRPLDDATFLEVLTVANLQREDVHPLEEADGYAEMMKTLRWDVPTIARKVGKGETYIYDRLKFHVLIPPIRELFFANRITPAHATELSRITAAQQQLAVDAGKDLYHGSGGLWQREGGDEDQFELDEETREETGDPYAGLKVVTVRELKSWISTHCRFVAAEVDPVLFPETVQKVKAAAEADLKIVSITREYRVHDDAKAEGQRTYGTGAWKRADGVPDPYHPEYADKEIVKTCEHAVLGVVVAGAGRSESFPVCIAKDKCKVHWANEQKAKEAKSKSKSQASSAASREQSWEREERLREEKREAFKPAVAPLREALLARVAAMPFKIGGALHTSARLRVHEGAAKHLGKPKSAEDLLRLVVASEVLWCASDAWSASERLPKLGKALGVDVDPIVKAHAPAKSVEEKGGPAKAANKRGAPKPKKKAKR